MNTRPSELTRIGPYRVSEQIGEGGMGVVYLASAPDGAQVSVKTLRPWLVGDADGQRRFEREVATLRRVHGRRIAEVIDADLAADPPYIVTRYIQGTPLARLVARDGPLHRPALHELACDLLEALASVHEAGVVHRDVKPANVVMSGDGPVLIDFGIAHAAEDTRLTITGFISGTPGYLAPETVIGLDPSPATDVHGWAATLVFAATGRPPYGSGPDLAVLDRIRRGEHDLRGVDEDLAVVLGAALRVDPVERPSVSEALAALNGPGEAETVAIPPVGPETTDETMAIPPAPPPPRQPMPRPPDPDTSPQVLGGDAGPVRPWRSAAVIGLGAVLLVFALSLAPYAGAVSVLAFVLTGRVTWRISRRLFERRSQRGRRKNDRLLATLASPWDLLASVVPAMGQTLMALVVGVVVIAGVDLVGEDGPRPPYPVGAVAAVLMMWWGPAAVRSRHGLRMLVAPVNRAPRAWWVIVVMLGVVVCLTVLSWESYPTVWWPADSAPGAVGPFPWQ